MRTPYLLSFVVLLGAVACGTDENENKQAMVADGGMEAAIADKNDARTDEVAIARRSKLMDERTACVLQADEETWKELSLTTDQIRWMEELKARMSVPNERTDATNDNTTYRTYTLSNSERRRMAEILTDEQLVQWLGMCPMRGDMAVN